MSKRRVILLAACVLAIAGVALALSHAAGPDAQAASTAQAAATDCPDDLIGKLMEYKLKQRSLAGDYDPDQSDDDCEDH